jgi:hypothetical protein
MNLTTTVTVVVSILLALLGYIVTYRNNLRLDRRKDRLMRVSEQLSDLYGPLFALIRANRRAWEAFRKDVRPGSGEDFWGTDPPPTAEEAAAWRLWIVEVLLPANEEMEKVIVNHSDLLNEQAIPDCLLEVCAHADSYKPLLRRWQDGDYEMNFTRIPFPVKALLDYTETAYTCLKKEQLELLSPKPDFVSRLWRSSNRLISTKESPMI